MKRKEYKLKTKTFTINKQQYLNKNGVPRIAHLKPFPKSVLISFCVYDGIRNTISVFITNTKYAN